MSERSDGGSVQDMTKREWFAGMAMQGLLASDNDLEIGEYELACISVNHADAMLKALAEPPTPVPPPGAPRE